MVIGNLICGKLADIHGRRPLLISGAIVQILVSSTFLWANTYYLLLVCRFLYGFGAGFTIALVSTIYA